ncbi:hypothetical protein TSUD_220050 [Trifolium subterraneum]|uniref:DUF223 domain-containing protein n=1 Tax=Trifolium subterraneum TaxID=3900 RepID=A0A2Z6NTW4_TRISU|nr:hypothetical protein TSUD_220050 [Trifolium subterraneum]
MSLMRKFTPVAKIHSLRLDWSIMGKMIQASVSTPCVDRFIDILFEDGVYITEFCNVKENVSSCMYTFNRFKLDFCMGTTMIPSISLAIPHYALKLFSTQKIRNYRDGLKYLVDVMGVVTDVFCQVPYENTGATETGVRVKIVDTRML